MKLIDVLHIETINMNLKARDKISVLEELLELLDKAGKLRNKEFALNKLIEREEILSTGIGHGIAIPHAITDGVDGIVTAFGRSKEGIDYEALDKGPVYLLFMLLSNDQDFTSRRIKILARISKLLKQEYVRETLKKIDNSQDVLNLIRREENRLMP